MGKTVVILQPGYLPWLGFFNQMLRSDIFIYYDDVQYDKHGWRNRNRIKSPQGSHWLTVPVLHKGLGKPTNAEIRIDHDQKWAKKHIGTLQQFYRNAPYTKIYLPELEEILARPWDKLVDLNYTTTHWLCEKLKIRRDIYRSSELGIVGGQTERLVNLCQHFGATDYLSGSAARNYLDTSLFEKARIRVHWQNYSHPQYPQQFGMFVPYLSVIDLLLNVGEESPKFLA